MITRSKANPCVKHLTLLDCEARPFPPETFTSPDILRNNCFPHKRQLSSKHTSFWTIVHQRSAEWSTNHKNYMLTAFSSSGNVNWVLLNKKLLRMNQ